HKHDNELSQGSVISGNRVEIYAQEGKVSVQGSDVVGDDSLTIQAKNIDIKEAENRVYSDDYYSKKKSGILSGGIGVTFGRQKQTTEADQTKHYAAGSQVGSLKGDTTLIAENHYTQTASAVSSVKGEVNILAKQVNIQAASDKYETHTKQTFEQKGLTLAITSPILSALQAVQSAVKSADKVGKSKNDRVNAMAAANVALSGLNAYGATSSAYAEMNNMANKIAQGQSLNSADADSLVGIQVTYGQQKSESSTHTKGKTAVISEINAGGKVNIVAKSADKKANIHIVGANIAGQQGTHLLADNQVNIKAAEQTHIERSTNKSNGVNVGVAVKVSGGIGGGITLGGNYGKGYGNGDETTYVASHVGTKTSETTVKAGGDTHIIGSQVSGKGVIIDTDNLHIESLQDKSTYQGKQMNIAGSVTVGAGVAASGSFNQSKTSLDYASVNEQAGIYAGDNGYDVNVKNKVSLTGGAILSQAPKEKNQLTAQDFEYSNIQNYSNAKSSAMGLAGGVSFGRDQTSDEDKELNDIYR
ncbi:hemagglutinin repeat-containing protein, partial [Rodentibacter trehalosifermentans]|uniref:hemagglutinin repeat-containing protein n=1 Tax=Rodentibacter trehalosifermentans TaxID=1908263 RepID=UPI001A97BFC4